MVMDFGELKAIVAQQITDRLDHSFVMRRTAEAESLAEVMKSQFTNVILVDYQPTCENMLQDFAARLKAALPEGVELHSLRLHETATSYAEWYNDEN
jgi:6-pyruvoyltetrahydropterin/6-carboxytetrahydropterin synthase